MVSNKIKGKAAPVNASFDVKVDGKAVFRLTDPMTANGGSASNALAPAEVQAPQVIAPSVADFCKTMVEKAQDEAAGQAALGDSGIHSSHQADEEGVRRGAGGALRAQDQVVLQQVDRPGRAPKPHVVLNGSTIDAGNAFQTKTQKMFDYLVDDPRGGKAAPRRSCTRSSCGRASRAADFPRTTN